MIVVVTDCVVFSGERGSMRPRARVKFVVLNLHWFLETIVAETAMLPELVAACACQLPATRTAQSTHAAGAGDKVRRSIILGLRGHGGAAPVWRGPRDPQEISS